MDKKIKKYLKKFYEMPNNVSNYLKIKCTHEETMDKIKAVLFDCDENGERIFTMEKLLPRPKDFSGQKGYSDYGHDWCCAIWGTKWDVYHVTIKDHGEEISLSYATAWSPNDAWGISLCNFVSKAIGFKELSETDDISITHRFYDYPGNFGGIMEWKPKMISEYKWYSFNEYARLLDKELYEWVLEFEKETPELQKDNSDSNQLENGNN